MRIIFLPRAFPFPVSKQKNTTRHGFKSKSILISRVSIQLHLTKKKERNLSTCSLFELSKSISIADAHSLIGTVQLKFSLSLFVFVVPAYGGNGYLLVLFVNEIII